MSMFLLTSRTVIQILVNVITVDIQEGEEFFLPGWKNTESRKVFKPYVTAGMLWTFVTHERNMHLSGVNFHALNSFCVCFSFSWHSSISFVIL